ncbi:unnamed protein product [Durusdinium trenchii]|uniref:Protein kinase domain-containing protein n=1 Tax=Durusdinium trenchii TaxID=1381693 RepID=A0ABP0IKS0_9DINO
MDFGQAVRTHSRCGTVRQRYFGFVGKPYYRGPECYLPRRPQVRVIAPDGAVADEVHFLENLNAAGQPDGYLCEVQMPHGVVPGQPCDAELAGYEAPPLDIFSCGVCLFILAWRLPPWSQALRSDPSFQYIQAHGIPQLLTHWRQRLLSAEAMNLLNQMVHTNPQHRFSVDQCLASDWLVGLGNEVPVHNFDDGGVHLPPVLAEQMHVDPGAGLLPFNPVMGVMEVRVVQYSPLWAEDMQKHQQDWWQHYIIDSHGTRLEMHGGGELVHIPDERQFPICLVPREVTVKVVHHSDRWPEDLQAALRGSRSRAVHDCAGSRLQADDTPESYHFPLFVAGLEEACG